MFKNTGKIIFSIKKRITIHNEYRVMRAKRISEILR